MKKLTPLFCLVVSAFVTGCGDSNSHDSPESTYREYQEMKAWDMYLDSETSRINQTYDNLNSSARNLGLPTID